MCHKCREMEEKLPGELTKLEMDITEAELKLSNAATEAIEEVKYTQEYAPVKAAIMKAIREDGPLGAAFNPEVNEAVRAFHETTEVGKALKAKLDGLQAEFRATVKALRDAVVAKGTQAGLDMEGFVGVAKPTDPEELEG